MGFLFSAALEPLSSPQSDWPIRGNSAFVKWQIGHKYCGILVTGLYLRVLECDIENSHIPVLLPMSYTVYA